MQEEQLFHQALEQPPDQRAVFLDAACAGDVALHARVGVLLRACENPGSFLQSPVAAAYSPTITERPLTEAPGAVIGPYKLLEQIGEGGFGVVFMAEQTAPVKRKVALKVIKPGMDTRQVIARFEAERQALALMDHPNIARVFDAGTTGETRSTEFGERNENESARAGTPHSELRIPHSTGRPYFAMELVKGVPITDYCDEHQLSPRERLELFLDICHAVQHAHQKGIIHRDIKPSNVLVTLHDDKPVVKVIDFGIAKATSGHLTDKTLFTNFAQLVGTPLYMSPEQAALNGLDVDTRSDIYSLGVLLYELLTGTTPFDKLRLQAAGYDEIRRIIQQEEPPRPSARISTLRNVETARSAAHRNLTARPPGPVRLGELDWIVMKALEKDRNRRYETAGALARDIERHLHDEPVQACPPSAWYRFHKFARRNKAALVTATAITVAVLLALGSLAIAVNVLANSNAQIKHEQEQTSAALGREKHANEDLVVALYFQRIALAERELSTNNAGRAEELLDLCPAELRGWEWHYLKRLRHAAELTFDLGERQQGGTGFGLEFSPDGRYVAAPCGGPSVRVWDVATGAEVLVLRGHTERIVRVAFSPDGRSLVSASDDRTIKVWTVTTGRGDVRTPDLDLEGHAGGVRGLAFSPDGRLLASVGTDRMVLLWDMATGRLIHQFPGEFTRYTYLNIAFSPDGRWLASGSTGNTVKVWDVETGQTIFTLRGHSQPVFSVFFSPDGRRMASLGWDDSAVAIWDLPTSDPTASAPETRDLKARFTQGGHSRGAWSAAFSPDGRKLAVAGGLADANVRIYEAATGRLLHTLEGHIYRAISVAFSRDGRRLVTTGMDRTVKLWETETGQEVLTLRGHADNTCRALFSPDGTRLASVSVEGTLKVWDATPLAEGHRGGIRTLGGHGGIVFGVAFSPDGQIVASASGDRTVKVWEAATGRELLTLRGHTDKVLCVAFSPDGRLLASGGLDRTVRLWDATSGREVLKLDRFEGPVRSLAFSSDGQQLATCGGLEVVQLWDTLTGRESASLRGHREFVQAVAFSPDGVHVATAGVDMTARIWSAPTGAEVGNLAHLGRVYSVAFSPDGHLLAAGDSNQNVGIWDWAAGREVHRLSGHTHQVFSVAFSPDGRHVASASWAEVIVRDADDPVRFRTLGGHAGTIWGVAFSPDGKRLAVASGYKDKGEVTLWDSARWQIHGEEQ